MNLHLLICVKAPLNWKVILKVLNCHRPDKVTFCHWSSIELDLEMLRPPKLATKWLVDIGCLEYFHVNYLANEAPIFNDKEETRIDILPGITSFHIEMFESAPEGSSIWATNYDGDVCVRIDEKDSMIVNPLPPLELLLLSGVNTSMQLVEVNDFDMSVLNEMLIWDSANIRLDHQKLREFGEFDNDNMKVVIRDNSGNQLVVDSRENDGFWLEDIVLQLVARNVEKMGQRVYRNLIINRDDENFQFKNGLFNIARSTSITPNQKNELSNLFNGVDWDSNVDIIYSATHEEDDNVDLEKIKNKMSTKLLAEIRNAGGRNEFDGIIVGTGEITIIEIKAARPKSRHIWKLLSTIPRELAPLAKKALIIHSWHPRSRKEQNKYDDVLRKSKLYYPSTVQIPWAKLDPNMIVPPLGTTTPSFLLNEIRKRFKWNELAIIDNNIRIERNRTGWEFYCTSSLKNFFEEEDRKQLKKLRNMNHIRGLTFHHYYLDEEE